MHWRSSSWLLALSWCQACAPAPPPQTVTIPRATSNAPRPAPLASPPAPSADSSPPVPEPNRAPPPPAEPHFVERIAHARGMLLFSAESPAHDVPIAIDDGCETRAGFTDAHGRYAFDDLALPAHLRSLDGFSLSNGESEDPGLLVPASVGATVEMEPITLERQPVVLLTHLQSTRAARQFMQGLDLWGPGSVHPSWLARAEPEQVILARKLGFVATVIVGDANAFGDFAGPSATDEEAAAAMRQRLADSEAALRLARLGQSRKPIGRVHTDAACVARASVDLPHAGSKGRTAP